MANFEVDRTSHSYLLGVAEYERDKCKDELVSMLDRLAREVRGYGSRLLDEAEHAKAVGTGDVQFAATAGAAVISNVLTIIAKYRAAAPLPPQPSPAPAERE